MPLQTQPACSLLTSHVCLLPPALSSPLMQPFPDFNTVPEPHTERMVQFHIHAANTQLRQLYYGFIAAMALGRALVLPKVGVWGEGGVVMTTMEK